MLAFWSRLSFSRKLFVLLMFPLAIQLVFFIALCLALNHAQTLSNRQFHEQQLVSALDQVLLDRGTSFGGLLRRSIFSVRIPPEAEAKIRQRIAGNLTRIRENPALDSSTRNSIDEIEASYASEETEQSRLKNLSLLQKLQMLKTRSDELQAFHDQIVKKLDDNQLAYAADRHKIDVLEFTLASGIFVDFCAAAISLYVFNRNLIGSLRALAENGRKISTNSTLPHRLQGSDELCTIDDALHASHAQLMDAKQHRQAINAMIAHDVRAPLTAISLLTHKLSGELSKNANPLSQEMQRLERNIQAVHNHVEDLLVVEKLESGKIDLKLAEVNLKSLLEDVCSSFVDAAKEKKVNIRLDAKECTVIADRMRLFQVVQNYLSNAIRYSPPDDEVVVQLVVAPDLVSVRVKDSGGGIKQSDQALLFSKFFQAGSAQNDKGFGLGLSICKQLIELHGGEVGVTSRPLSGATFWFTLPKDEID